VRQSSQSERRHLASDCVVPEFFSLSGLTAAGKLPLVTPLARPGNDATAGALACALVVTVNRAIETVARCLTMLAA